MMIAPLARVRCRPLRLLLLAVLVVELLRIDRVAHALQVNAWSPCPAQTTEHRSSIAQVTECATAVVPLCYADMCGSPGSSSNNSGETISLSLKRIPANTSTTATTAVNTSARNAWMIPDRSDVVLPSEGTCALEYSAQRL